MLPGYPAATAPYMAGMTFNESLHPRDRHSRQFVEKAHSSFEGTLPAPWDDQMSVNAKGMIAGDDIYTSQNTYLGRLRNAVPDGYNGVDLYFEDGSVLYGAMSDDPFTVESALARSAA